MFSHTSSVRSVILTFLHRTKTIVQVWCYLMTICWQMFIKTSTIILRRSATWDQIYPPTPKRNLGPGIPTPSQDGTWARHTHPPQEGTWSQAYPPTLRRDLGPGIPVHPPEWTWDQVWHHLPVDAKTDRHLWKNYLPTTSFVSGKNSWHLVTKYSSLSFYQFASQRTKWLSHEPVHFYACPTTRSKNDI